MRQAENKVYIEGILSEIDLKYGSYMKNGTPTNIISGSIIVRVEQDINKVPTTLDIPVQMFASELTNAGKPNPAYKAIEEIMKNYISIAAAGIDGADRVRISKGSIKMNEYWASEDKLVSYPRINASFVTRIPKSELNQKATFNVEFVVGKKSMEVDKDGIETGRLKIDAILVQYGDKVDVVPFYAIGENIINPISSYWNEGDTVKAAGKLNFTSRTEKFYEDIDFGEPVERTRTIRVSDLIITGGSQTPLEGDFAFDATEIKNALAARKSDLESKKAKEASRAKTKSAPANDYSDLGF